MAAFNAGSRRAPAALAVLLAAGLAATGCSTTPPVAGSNAAMDRGSDSPPEFTGPWSAEFRDFYGKANNEFQRDVLRDGSISDLEVTEMQNKHTACLAGNGFTEIRFQADGGMSFADPPGMAAERATKLIDQCSEESGEFVIGALHSMIRINPDNLDWNTIMASCLIRKGGVDPSYTADDYAKDWENETGPAIGAGSASHVQCSADPLGLFE